MPNITLYTVSVPTGQNSKVDWTECDINPPPTQYLYGRFISEMYYGTDFLECVSENVLGH